MIWLLLSLAHAGVLAIDLDGDGTQEGIQATPEGVIVGGDTIPCFSDDGDSCEVTPVDLLKGDKRQELMLCHTGPRDDRHCELYQLTKEGVVQIAFEPWSSAQELVVNGSGFVYAKTDAHRLFTRTRKYAWKAGKLDLVAQPLYSAPAPATLHVEKTFQLHHQPGSTQLVGTAKPDSDIAVLGEHGDKEGWLLVRLSSGISGWVEASSLEKASVAYMRRMQAG